MEQENLVKLVKDLEERLVNLKKILSKYGVNSTKELLLKIEKGELPEHPTYEDYLEARSYELEAKEILHEIQSRLREIEKAVISA